jgi:uncharacterized protein involved in outer membrane biogenesis
MPMPRAVPYVIAMAVVAAVVVAFFDWNWLRAPISSYVSARLGRAVVIEGDLRGEFALTPLLTAERVTVANTAWGSAPVMAAADRVAVRVELMSLLGARVSLPEIAVDRPVLLLERDADGTPNWRFDGGREVPRIGALDIDAGSAHYLDVAQAVDVQAAFVSDADAASGELPVRFEGAGTIRGSKLTFTGRAATLLALDDDSHPYRVVVDAKSGATHGTFEGTVIPARPDNVDGVLALQGRDLAELHPIIPVPFPWTPPYRMSGTLRHDSGVWSLRDLRGKVGNSDLAGRFDFARRNARTHVDADLVSDKLDYRDLGGLVGLPPAGVAPRVLSAAAQAEAARRARSSRVLPDRPYNLEGLRAVDGTVRLRGKRFATTRVPLDNLNAVMTFSEGVLKLDPLDFGVAGGHVASRLTLDARGERIRSVADVSVRNVELKDVVPAVKPPAGSAGKLGGRAHLTATGNSVAAMLATSNGEVSLIGSGGDASELAVVLTNVDLARAAALLLRGDRNTPIRCAVAGFTAENGVLRTNTLVVDTDVEMITGGGTIDLAREAYDLDLSAQSKRPSLLALRGPIRIDGTFAHPLVRPATGPMLARVGASVALGALAPPAALLPLVDFGGAEDADCRALLRDANRNVKRARVGAG